MAEQHLITVVRRLQHLAGALPAAELADAQLLERYATRQDPEAFELIVRRHGPLVWRVCHRVLGQADGADDCFQATFLVLARRAGSIRKPAALASWLHGVALRVARAARAAARPIASRRPPEPAAASADPAQEAAWRELARLVEEEVHGLPEQLRLAVLACYWQGLTNDEAAQRLGWPVGTVKTRLARARELLHRRLVKRGVTLPVGVVALLCAPAGTEAMVPGGCLAATVRAAVGGAGSAVSAEVARLAAMVLHGGMMSQARLALAVVLAFGLAVAGAGAWWSSTAAPPDEPEQRGAATARLMQPAMEPMQGHTDQYGDPLPPGAIMRLGTVRFRHPFWVSGLAYTPDERVLAAACWDGGVHLWDPRTGTRVRRLQCRTEPGQTYLGVAVTADSSKVIAVENEHVHVWELASGRKQLQFGDGNAFGLALSPDGQVLAKGLSGERPGQQVSLWDVATGRKLRTLGAAKRLVQALAFAPDGKLLAAGDGHFGKKSGSGFPIRLWDPESGRLLRELQAHAGGVTAVAFAPTTGMLASASHDATIRIWNVNEGRLIRTITVPEEATPMQAAADGERAKGLDYGGVLAIAYSPDGRCLASGGYDGTIHLWEIDTGKRLTSMRGHGREVVSLVFSRDGKRLTSGSFDNTIRQWVCAAGQELRPRDGHAGPVNAIAVSPDQRLLAVASGTSWYRAIILWSLVTGKQQQVLHGHSAEVHALAFAPNGRVLASAADDGTIRTWDAETGRTLCTLRGHAGAVYDVAFAANNTLISHGSDGTLRSWDSSIGVERHKVQLHQPTSGLVLSRDGRLAALGGTSVQVWDVATRRLLRRFPLEWTSFAFADGGRTLMTHGRDGAVRNWSVVSGKQQQSFRGPSWSPAHAGTPNILSPDGRLLGVTRVGGIDLWEMATGTIRRRFVGHQGFVIPFTFGPAGRTVLTGGNDTTVLIWDLARRHDPRPARLTDADLDRCWRDLRGDAAERADVAIGMLAARPEQSMPFLDQRLVPVTAPDTKGLAALIGDLNSEDFAVRDKANVELERLGERAASALQAALARPPSLEVVRRIERLLARLRPPLAASDVLQGVRAVEVLERIDRADARRLLKRLAGGVPDALVTQHAVQALRRLERQ